MRDDPSTTRYMSRTRLMARLDPARLEFRGLSGNPSPGALALLAASPDKIDFTELALNQNPAAVALLRANLDRMCDCAWGRLSMNPCPEAVVLMLEHPDKISWFELSRNTCPAALALLATRPDKADWEQLSGNPAAIDIILAHPDKVSWYGLAHNPSPGALALMAANPDKVVWRFLMKNPNPDAAALLATAPYPENTWGEGPFRMTPSRDIVEITFEEFITIDPARSTRDSSFFYFLSMHPHIFEEAYDYAAMRAAIDVHREGLTAAAFHPRRLARWLEAGLDPDDF